MSLIKNQAEIMFSKQSKSIEENLFKQRSSIKLEVSFVLYETLSSIVI